MKAWTVEFDDYTKDEHGTWSQVCNPHLLEIYDSNTDEVERFVDEWQAAEFVGLRGATESRNIILMA